MERGNGRDILALELQPFVLSFLPDLCPHLGIGARAAMRGSRVGSQRDLSDIGDGSRGGRQHLAIVHEGVPREGLVDGAKVYAR